MFLSVGAFASPGGSEPRFIMVGNGDPITPKHDGIHYFIAKDNHYLNDSLSADEVKNAVKVAREAGKVVYDFLSVHIAGDLPVIVAKEFGGVKYEILLDKLVFTPNGNTITVAALITKTNGDSYAFGGENVRFTGQGGIESGNLNLLMDNNLELKTQQLNTKVKVKITGGGLTYGCDGFENVSIFGNVSFDRELLVPEDNNPDTDFIDPSKIVTSRFKLEKISDFNDIVIEIKLPPFQITKMKGFGFQVEKAIIDLSAKNNAAFFRLPVGYIPDIEGTGWMGVSIQSLKVKLPSHFVNRKTKQRIEIDANGLLIDRYGFSGQVLGKNFLTLEEGDVSGWDISINTLGLNFLKNQVTGGTLEGQIRPAVVKNEKQALGYKAQFDPIRDFYNFSVFVRDTIEFPFLKAGAVTLTKNSSIKLTLVNKRFNARANLNGELNIKAEELTLKKYKFSSMIVSTQPPYLFVGYFGKSTSDTSSTKDSTKTDVFNGFSLVMKEPVIVNKEENVGVAFGIMINLDKMGIAAEGDFIIEGQLEKRNNRHYWVNKSFSVSKIKVSADINPIKFTGELVFIKNDPIYGKAFFGRLAAELNFGKKYVVQSAALFGNKDKNPYWFVDLMYGPSSNNTKGISIKMRKFRIF